MRVLIVEDELAMAGLLRSALSEEGHQVTVATRGDEALEITGSAEWDLIVLDLMLPGMNGFRVAEEVRKAQIQTPILVLTARDNNSDTVRALDAGADDYLSKPFALEVFLARVRAVSRRGPIAQPVSYIVGSLELNSATREVRRDGRHIPLTPREYTLLELLIRNRGRVLHRTTIVDSVWGWDTNVSDNTLDVFIRTLRQKVELPSAAKLIHTVRGVGYCLKENADS